MHPAQRKEWVQRLIRMGKSKNASELFQSKSASNCGVFVGTEHGKNLLVRFVDLFAFLRTRQDNFSACKDQKHNFRVF